MTEKIQAIINKVREMAKYNPDLEAVLHGSAHAEIRVTTENELVLTSVQFDWYSKVVAAPTQLFVVPEYGERKTIARYESFDEFISM